ncbi:MAG: hypothetical protein JNN25_06725 [Candidatus Kapabacteria bacterium]|nr:hypothetical protein [Candidatus Kapabacteria bacterium]
MKFFVIIRLFCASLYALSSAFACSAIVCSAFVCSAPALHAQVFGAGADTVFSVRWGTGQNFGREQFPRNVLGLPDTSARADRPAVTAEAVCSLGLGGEIIIGWKNAMLLNRTGADFTIFENVFLYFGERRYAEPAKVAVSQDGVRFVEFPFDSLSLRGCAGVTPTNGDKSAFNPNVSGGDSFDLAVIGMDSVRFIKITDVSQIVLNSPQHPFYDPTISGFDLDAVVGISLLSTQRMTSVVLEHQNTSAVQASVIVGENGIVVQSLSLLPQESVRAELYTLLGSCVSRADDVISSAFIPTDALPKGAYFLVLRRNGYAETRKIMVW